VSLYQKIDALCESSSEFSTNVPALCFTQKLSKSEQQQGFPKYVHLRAGLLLKLEKILHTLNDEGHAVEGLTIMSGYRTPFSNKAIGNVQYSRHV
jgi:hypothetical protein